MIFVSGWKMILRKAYYSTSTNEFYHPVQKGPAVASNNNLSLHQRKGAEYGLDEVEKEDGYDGSGGDSDHPGDDDIT